MHCAHFGVCGSCSLYGSSYEEQFESKINHLKAVMSPYYDGYIEPHFSASSHYRMRAEFRIWHEGDRAYYAMGNAQKNGIVKIKECPKVSKAIEDRMWRLLDAINCSPKILKHKLFGVEFLSSTTNQCLIVLLYHRKLDEAWQQEAHELEQKLDAYIVGRSRKQKVVLSQEYIIETVVTQNNTYRYRYYEGAFTQPNTMINGKMIQWVQKQSEKMGGDLLELYCGHGNFTIPLSNRFDRVLATEISKRSISAAYENSVLNGVSNITFVRMASEELSQALQKQRSFRRLEKINLDRYCFKAVLVDPPRAGLDTATLDLVMQIPHIIYISCNHETLARDLSILDQTHAVETIAAFDQFPYTKHIECGVVLSKRN